MEKRNSLQEFLDELDRAEKMLPEPLDVETEVKTPIKDLEKKVGWLLDLLGRGGNANRDIKLNGANILRPFTDINLISGSGVTITAAANQTTKYTDITISTSGTSAGYQQPTSGTVNGTNQVFVWATAPNVIVVDQGRPMQKTSSDGTINWTGTTTTTLLIAPNFDIFATA